MVMNISNVRLTYLRRLCERLEEKMKSERLFLQPHLTLMDVASRLNASRHDLSYVVNHYIGKSYVDYINELRMNEAIRLIESHRDGKLKINELARLAGFSDRTTFCRACKKFKGLSPTELEELLITNDTL